MGALAVHDASSENDISPVLKHFHHETVAGAPIKLRVLLSGAVTPAQKLSGKDILTQ